jgi:hypothetical protein
VSYAYDVMRRVWNEYARPLVVEKHGEMLAFEFEGLIEEMHSANHDLPSKDGVFSGDGINKDPRVSRAARELEEFVKELKKKSTTEGGQREGPPQSVG